MSQLRHVREDDLLRVITEVSTAIGALDTISDLVDSKPAQALRRYRQQLANTVEDMHGWFDDDYNDFVEEAANGQQ